MTPIDEFGVATGGTEIISYLPQETPTSVLDHIQTGLDIAGLVPGFGEIADGANALIYLGKGDQMNAAISGAAMVPLLGWAATAFKFGKKSYKVSQAVDATGSVKYVGITSTEIVQREAKHKVKDAFKHLTFEPVPGATELSRLDARIWEQTLINQYGGPNGGQLLNQTK